MKKFSNSLIIIFLLSNFIYCKELVSVQAQYDPITKTLIYDGYSYKNTEQKEIVFQEETEMISFNSEEKKSDSFFDGFWFNFIGFSTLACFAGAMSGLTVGYLSIDMLILEIKLISGTEQEKIYANKIKKIISDHHWILVTLLLCNAFACEAMPILLDKLVNDVMAIVISVTVLLFVGEIVPQALCTGPNQMKIAAFLAPFTYSLMIITYPLSFPIAKFMDCVIGLHGKTRFCNSDLKSVIELHVKEYKGNLNPQQMGHFTGFLDIMNKKVGELMLPIEKVFKLDYKYKINKANIDKLIESGYSRIPIYEDDSNNLVGILRVKDLIGKDLLRTCLLNELDIKLSEPIHITEDSLFLDLFEKFKSGKSHMAFIHQKELEIEFLHKVSLTSDNYDKIIEKNIPLTPIVGIITLENLIEFWFNIQILDEEDYRAHDMLNRSLTRSRKKLFDAIGIEKVNDKINKLYDDSEKKERNYNDEFSNDYHAF